MKRPGFSQRHPYWFVALLEVVIIFVYLLAGTVAHFANLSNLGLYAIANLSLMVIAAALLTGMGWWRTVGFRRADKPADLWFFAIPFLPVIFNLIPGVQVNDLQFLLGVLAITLMVGFVEEVFFRGLMLNALKSRGVWKAAVITALLFGLTHALNSLAGKSVADDVAQIFYAMAIGFAFAALVLKKGIIWPLVLAHFVIDFANFIQRPGFSYPSPWDLLIVLATAVIFTGYGLYLMRLRDPEAAPQS
jgi:uncharacterized protein